MANPARFPYQWNLSRPAQAGKARVGKSLLYANRAGRGFSSEVTHQAPDKARAG